MIDPEIQNLARDLRHRLHARPELSGHEAGTTGLIEDFLTPYEPDDCIGGLGGHGLAAVFSGRAPGPTIAIRCELDALPIAEPAAWPHRSLHPGVSHKCGHDGHMAMVAALAPLLRAEQPTKGRVVLLFQPSEETGAGADAILRDARFAKLAPDWIFALHNLPGFPLGQVLHRRGVFATGSTGMIIRLRGQTAHASQPECGNSPAAAVCTLLPDLVALPHTLDRQAFALVTITHSRLGEPTFGVAPGEAEIFATLRADRDEDLERLRAAAANCARRTAATLGLEVEIAWAESFAATVNDSEAVAHVTSAAHALGLASTEMAQPIRGSEDFGRFSQCARTALFGLGSGVDTPPLHHRDYDFPDALLPIGTALFATIIRTMLRN